MDTKIDVTLLFYSYVTFSTFDNKVLTNTEMHDAHDVTSISDLKSAVRFSRFSISNQPYSLVHYLCISEWFNTETRIDRETTKGTYPTLNWQFRQQEVRRRSFWLFISPCLFRVGGAFGFGPRQVCSIIARWRGEKSRRRLRKLGYRGCLQTKCKHSCEGKRQLFVENACLSPFVSPFLSPTS